MQCSIALPEAEDNYHSLQLAFDQRFLSLRMQMALASCSSHQTQLSDRLRSHHDACKAAKGGQLLGRQAQLAVQQERESELSVYEEKIRQLRYLLSSKEQDVWEQRTSGKRVKNIALHKESLRLLEQQNKLLRQLVEEEATNRQLLADIELLGKGQLESEEEREELPFFELGGINTGVLDAIVREQNRHEELLRVEQLLTDQLASLGPTHQTTSEAERAQPGQDGSNSQAVPESSVKTISTEGQESSL